MKSNELWFVDSAQKNAIGEENGTTSGHPAYFQLVVPSTDKSYSTTIVDVGEM